MLDGSFQGLYLNYSKPCATCFASKIIVFGPKQLTCAGLNNISLCIKNSTVQKWGTAMLVNL
jgi:hypothetical protein